MSVAVNLASLKTGFPKGMPVPGRLLAFGSWLREVAPNSLGDFDALESEPLDVTYTNNQAATNALRRSLGIFLTLPDGSRLALWNHTASLPSVVLMGSEGELVNVAGDFDEFLLAWSLGRTGIDELDKDDDATRSARPTLAKWLDEQGVKPLKGQQQTPSFKTWFKAVVDANMSPAAREALALAATAKLSCAPRVEVDVHAVVQAAPSGFIEAAAGRLEAFANWLARSPQGGLTESELRLAPSSNRWDDDDRIAAALGATLATFLSARAPAATRTTVIALWNYGADVPAVVALTNDKWRTVAVDLDTFLVAWSRGATGIADLDLGNRTVQTELGEWLRREGIFARKGKAPDIAAWLKRTATTIKSSEPPKNANRARAVKPPLDMAQQALAVLGREKTDAAVVAFCERLGIDISSEQSDRALRRYFVAKHGYSLQFVLPDGAVTGPRIMAGVRFHCGKHKWWSYVAGRDVSFSRFRGVLPRELSFAMSRDDVFALLGQPTSDDGSLEWKDELTGHTLSVDFAGESDSDIPAGQLKWVSLSIS